MPSADITFRIGGEAGQGVESGGAGLCKALMRSGLHVLGIPDYYSRIRGGHNFFTIRASQDPVYALTDAVQVLIALTPETVTRHLESLSPGAAVIIDKGAHLGDAIPPGSDLVLVRAPLVEIATDEGAEIMSNTAALAVAASLTGVGFDHLAGVIEQNFGKKSAEVAQANLRVGQRAYDWTEETAGRFAWRFTGQADASGRVLITGSEAFAMGALVAGCKFVAGYPMTPATPVLEYMSTHAAEWGLVTKHTESEIAAVNMCVGAAHAGVRAMAPTSGGGFDLMTEGLSLAAMTETPLVIYLAQRPGPATGLATRTCQADLFLALHAGHGEFPRVLLAPHSPVEAFECAIRAFSIAERYQCLVVVLSDQYLASSVTSEDAASFDVENVAIDRGKLLDGQAVAALDVYARYADTEDGVSPRALPGSDPKAVYLASGNEHREDGHITEDPDIATAQALKRLRKGKAASAEMRAPLFFGPEDADLTFVSWGSSCGAVREAVDALNVDGRSANMVHFCDLWPFPREEARRALGTARRIINVEGNATAQFASLLNAECGIKADTHVLKFDGRGLTGGYILDRLGAE